MVDEKPVKHSTVILKNNNNKIISDRLTDYRGKFKLRFTYNNKFSIIIKKKGYIPKQINISTFVPEGVIIKRGARSLIIVLNKTPENYNPNSSKKIVASYGFSNDGVFIDNYLAYSKETNNSETALANSIEVTENLRDDVEAILKELSDEEREKIEEYIKGISLKADSIIYTANIQAERTLILANSKSKEIIDKANKEAQALVVSKKNELEKSITDRQIKELAVSKEELNTNKDVKENRDVIIKFEQIVNKTKKDSLEYNKASVNIKKRLIELAKAKLKIDKLNARTREDSLEIERREAKIINAEKEIEQANNKIELQEFEIKQQETLLYALLLGLLFIIGFSIYVFNSYQEKKKTNKTLENKNAEIQEMLVQLKEQNVRIELINSNILDSITYAKTIQLAILPLQSIMDNTLNAFILYKPKDIVSGDFYWYSYFESSKCTFMIVADSTGHGVPGAFMSMIGSRLMSEIINEKHIHDPKEILEQLNLNLKIALMQDENQNNDGMDVCLCKIEENDNGDVNITYSGAKRPLYFVRKNTNEIESIRGDVKSIGGRKRLRRKKEIAFTNKQIALQKGDMIYLTSDGLVDQSSPDKRKFGIKKFYETIVEVSDFELSKQKEELEIALDKHQSNAVQRDDITVVGIKL